MDEPTVGDLLGPWTDPPLTVTDFVRYQGASGDMNPVHHDTLAAQAVGYDQPLGVGMYTAGRLSVCLTDLWGPERIRRFAVRFKEPVWPGDVLTYGAVVAGVRHEEGRVVVEVDASCRRQTGGVAVTATATFEI